jgi:uncharacterized protein (TIGR00369 family)
MAAPVMTADDIDRHMREHFPEAAGWSRITAIRDDELDLTLPFSAENLRPGGTLSGPALMALADTAMYFLIWSQLGPLPLAVTSNLNMNFLRRPPPADLHATARMLKLGSKLAVGEVHIRTAAEGRALVAQASVSYALSATK